VTRYRSVPASALIVPELSMSSSLKRPRACPTAPESRSAKTAYNQDPGLEWLTVFPIILSMTVLAVQFAL